MNYKGHKVKSHVVSFEVPDGCRLPELWGQQIGREWSRIYSHIDREAEKQDQEKTDQEYCQHLIEMGYTLEKRYSLTEAEQKKIATLADEMLALENSIRTQSYNLQEARRAKSDAVNAKRTEFETSSDPEKRAIIYSILTAYHCADRILSKEEAKKYDDAINTEERKLDNLKALHERKRNQIETIRNKSTNFEWVRPTMEQLAMMEISR